MKKILFVLIISILAVTTCFANGQQEKEEANEYVFATNATWPPFEYIDEDGNMVGYEIELLQKIAEVEGFSVTIKNVAFETIFAGIANGSYDGIAAGITVTPERAEVVDFADAFANVGQVLVVKQKDIASIQSIDDLSGKKVGVQLGTTGDFSLDETDVIKKQYNDIGSAIEDMINGNLSAVVCDSLIASNFVLKNENYNGLLSVTGEPFTEEMIAMCVDKGETNLLNMLNEGQKKLEESGELAQLKEKYQVL